MEWYSGQLRVQDQRAADAYLVPLHYVRKRSVQLEVSNEAIHLGEPVGESLEDIIDQEPISDAADVMDEVINDFVERSRGLGPPEISTGIKELDRAIIGLRPGRVMVIAARPGMGKSALAGTICRAVLKQDYAACLFNLEMAKQEILERELAFMAHMNLRRVMSAKDIQPDEMQRVLQSRNVLPRDMWAVYDDCFSIQEIQRKALLWANRLKKEGKRLGVVIIDYLQLIGDVSTEGRQQSIAACSRIAKLLSKQLGCTVMLLSQLNRNCEYRDNKRPMLSDLRESGAIEQDADCVIFVYRDHVYNQSVSPDDTELIIGKQRSGPIGTVRVRFNPRTVSFEDLPPLVCVPGTEILQ